MYFLAIQELISLPIQKLQVACESKKDSMVEIVTSTFVLFLSETCRLMCCSLFLGEILSLHQGQGLEIYWRDHLSCPSEEEYIDMVVKSRFFLFVCLVRFACLIRINQRQAVCFVLRSGSWSCFHLSSLTSLGKASKINSNLLCTHFFFVGGDDSSLIPLVNLIAIYYQIRDDYMNLQSKEVTKYSFYSNQESQITS